MNDFIKYLKPNKLITENFFYIDSNNCNNIESRLYGFVILDDKILINDNSL